MVSSALGDNVRVCGMRELTIETPFLSEEANFTFIVAADQADDDCFLLTALETVYAAQLDSRKLFFECCEGRQL